MSTNIAVITGSTRGIGEACAELFSARGYKVILVGRHAGDLERVAKKTGGLPVKGDITDAATDKLILKAVGRNDIAVLINNAGMYRRLTFEESSESDWREQFELNLFAAARITKTLLPKLKAHGSASIINISSSVGLKPAAGMTAYSASKAAMNNWTQSLALELAPFVRANGICPGIIDTPLHGFTAKQKHELKTAQPLQRIGEAADVAKGALFLAESPWVTGVLLPIDGGISLT